MSLNLPNWFTKKYTDTVQHRLQQRKHVLADTVSHGGMFVGDSVFFPRMGAAEMYDSPRLAKIALANVAMDMIEVKAKPKFIAFGIWDPDKNKLNENVAAEYGIAAANATTRGEDAAIATALTNAAGNGVVNSAGVAEAITTIGDYNTVADLDVISEGIAILGTQYAMDGDDVTFVSPYRTKVNMSLDPYMAKSDMKNNLPWNDLNFRSYEKLNSDLGAPVVVDPANRSTGVDCFLYVRSAVVSAYNDERTQINERLGGELADMIGEWVQMGAAAREPKGIVRIKSKYNFGLARHPILNHPV